MSGKCAVIGTNTWRPFRLTTRRLEARLAELSADATRTCMFVVNGEELDAVIWGLTNYKPGATLYVSPDEAMIIPPTVYDELATRIRDSQ